MKGACPVVRIISKTKGRLGPFNLRRISGDETWRCQETAGGKLNRKYGFNKRCRVGRDSEREENDRCEDKQINSIQVAAGIVDT